MNKRGLSDIVTAILLILVILVAIVIIWVSFLPTVNVTGEETEKTTACLSLKLEPTSCSYSRCGPADAILSEVQVSRGADNVNSLSGLNFVYTNDEEREEVKNLENSLGNTDLPGSFGTEKYLFSFSGFGSRTDNVRVIPSVGEQKSVCRVGGSVEQCLEDDYDGSVDFCADFNTDGRLDLDDVNDFVLNYTSGNLSADASGDGVINFDDVAIFCFEFTEGDTSAC